MTEKITQSFVLTPAEIDLIKAKSDKDGTSDSAALRMILREWAEMKSIRSTTTPAPSQDCH